MADQTRATVNNPYAALFHIELLCSVWSFDGRSFQPLPIAGRSFLSTSIQDFLPTDSTVNFERKIFCSKNSALNQWIKNPECQLNGKLVGLRGRGASDKIIGYSWDFPRAALYKRIVMWQFFFMVKKKSGPEDVTWLELCRKNPALKTSTPCRKNLALKISTIVCLELCRKNPALKISKPVVCLELCRKNPALKISAQVVYFVCRKNPVNLLMCEGSNFGVHIVLEKELLENKFPSNIPTVMFKVKV